MNYTKPEVVVLGAAGAVIQKKSGTTVIDSPFTVVSAYELDEE